MVQAAADGVIDFSQADPYDNAWWLKLKWLTNEISRKNQVRVMGLRHARYLSTLARADLDSQYVENNWDKAYQLEQATFALLFPWIIPEDEKSVEQALRDSWVNTYGDPNDPEVQAEIDATVRWLQAHDVSHTERAS
jgi:hypothetical protein